MARILLLGVGQTATFYFVWKCVPNGDGGRFVVFLSCISNDKSRAVPGRFYLCKYSLDSATADFLVFRSEDILGACREQENICEL